MVFTLPKPRSETLTKAMSEPVPWGRVGRDIAGEVAVFFYNSPESEALRDVQEWARENSGRVESAHGILKRIEEFVNGSFRIHDEASSITVYSVMAYTEEDVGLDTEGRFGRTGEAVFLEIQGGGIMLNSPESFKAAEENRTPKYELSINQADISRLLAGSLPNGEQIRLYAFDQLKKEDPDRLPQTYAIVTPLKDLEDTPQFELSVSKLPKNKLFIMRAGHPLAAERCSEAIARAGITKYSNIHTLKNADPQNPGGRVLPISRYSLGLDANYLTFSGACFVGVRRVEPQKPASPLERLAGLA